MKPHPRIGMTDILVMPARNTPSVLNMGILDATNAAVVITLIIALSHGGNPMCAVGDKFRLFKKGNLCKVTAIKNGTVKFESDSGITGSFPLAKADMHFRTKKEK
jgi:hypothetical protein